MAGLDKRDTVPIPQPTGYPLIGNILELSGEVPFLRFLELGKKYGDIYSLNLMGQRQIFVSNAELMRELCDEKRFEKDLSRALRELREGVHDGLFTALGGEKNWTTAHRTLVPAFGPLNIKDMFDSMKDIASQLVLKWARHGTAYKIPVSEDFTRLTLDTLALCAMDYRFNSFYTEDVHPFINSMMNFLKYAEARSKRPTWMQSFYKADEARWWADIAYMRQLSGDLVQQRRDNPNNSRDLLNAMIHGKDPRTQEGLPEESIIDNMITFLIAGHETTSGMLSYVFYCLMKNPDAYRKAQEEVDRVIGKDTIQSYHLDKLPYITAVLRETSRLYATAPAFSVTPKNEQGEVIGGQYRVEKGEVVVVLLRNAHTDPAVYGEDAEEFKPERMLGDNFSRITPYWKPFGNGARGCIGRPFAWQEMMLLLPMLLQYFNFTLDDPGYVLQTAFTLTIKPKDLYIRSTLREGWTPLKIERHLAGSTGADTKQSSSMPLAVNGEDDKGTPITILYGSNSGTCEVFAQTLAADARAHGFKATKVDTLDSAEQNLPTDEPVVIVTASYEGEPTDNASHFYNWLQNMSSEDKLESKFAVFGCGHSDWKQTFHRVPKAIDNMLEKAGGQRICEMGSADASKGDVMSEFQAWEDELLWPALQKQFGGKDGESAETSSLAQAISIEVFSKRASNLRTDVSDAKVLSTKTLTAPGAPVKKHIELQLPSTLTYRAGDYLAVLPLNPPETVHRVARRFSLPWDAMLRITSRTGTTLPTEHPISAHNLFAAYLELSQPATKRNMAMLIEAARDEKTKNELSELVSGDFQANITDKRISLLDLLERYQDIELPLSAFVASLISMRVRQYSISSSPLSNANIATLTYAVLDEPAISGVGRHVGAASSYLSQLQPGDIIHVAVKPSHAAFHLPSAAETTPVIMIAAGAGLAPFRGFVQERAAQIGSGRKLAPAHLYFGCRHPEQDDLYRDELNFWEKMGAVTVHRSFSRAPEQSGGHKYIDGMLLDDRHKLVPLWDEGAKVYVCGSRGLGDSVKQAFLKVKKEKCGTEGIEITEDELEEWFEKQRNERYSTDVFA